MKRLLAISVFTLTFYFSHAQNIGDALRYSYLQPGGSARFVGAGGALGALGADYGVLSTNPAGLAMFRKNELVLTPGLRFAATDATLRGGNATTSDDKSNFNFNNFGMIFHTEPRNARWATFNVGIGVNKMANFHGANYYTGKSPGSIMNAWFDDANNALNNGVSTDDLDPFTSKLGYDANAIYQQDNLLTYDFAGAENAAIDRSQSIITTGGINEMVLSFAGNYDEKLMVGATVGVPFITYKQESTYEESDPTDAVPYFDKLTYTEFLRTNGIGINLKMGLIYKVSPMLRLGAAFHTPTFMGLTDNFTNTFQYGYTDGSGGHEGDVLNAPDGTLDYRLRTPWRAILSSALVLRKYGFLSAEVEFLDYRANRFNLTSDVASNDNQNYERDLNTALGKTYQKAMNVRLGGEASISNFRIRAGANLLGKAAEGKTGFNTAITGGIGVRLDAFYLDLGVRHYLSKGDIQPYNDPYATQQPVADITTNTNDFVLTVGLRF